MLVFDKNVYRDKAYGGWLGKNIGGTLGGPYEGAKELLDLKFYPEPPDGKPLPNDDLDLQLVWLHALEQYGPRLTAVHLGREWVDHVRFAFDEYGYGLYNLRRGILPPVSGWFSNPFVDCMGAPIRSEIWAMIAPGLPELAAYYAWNDAVVDHGNGESVWGEVLFAAIESAAFVESDPRTLIDIGMRLIPKESRVARAVRLLLELHAEGVPWQQAREAILKEYGHDNFTDAPQNIAFTLLGWLYGEDFEDALLKATNCGYDTDCTAATLGAILGIVHGAGAIPEKWSAPVGEAVVLSPAIVGIDAPQTLDELTERTMTAANETLAAWRIPLRIGDSEKKLTLADMPKVTTPFSKATAWKHTAVSWALLAGSDLQNGLDVSVDYGTEGPAIGRLEQRTLTIRLNNPTSEMWEGTLSLVVPAGWTAPDPLPCSVRPGESIEWVASVTSSKVVEPTYTLYLGLSRKYDTGALWNVDRMPIAMVPKLEWEISAPDGQTYRVSASTTEIPFTACGAGNEPGWWRAKTTIRAAVDQEARLIVATVVPMRARLRGEKVLEAVEPRIFMPAYHRAVPSTRQEVSLRRGANELEVEVHFEKDVQPVIVAVVDPTRGRHHAALDVTFELG